MATVKVACPSCGKGFKVSEDQLQKRSVCNGCGRQFLPAEARVKETAEPTRAPAEAQWYVEIKGRQGGPFARDRIVNLFASGEITGDSLIWHEGMPNWHPLKSVAEFASAVSRPLSPETEGAAEPASVQADELEALRAGSKLPIAGTAPQQRPAGLVFVIFYTALSGILTSILGFFLEIGSGIAGRAGGMLPFEIAERGRLALVAVEFLGILVFFFGLTGLVCAYGLWSGQQWGKRLTIRWYFVYGVFALIGLIVSIATGAGVVSSIVSVGVCVGILGFLFGSAELSRHVGRFLESGKK